MLTIISSYVYYLYSKSKIEINYLSILLNSIYLPSISYPTIQILPLFLISFFVFITLLTGWRTIRVYKLRLLTLQTTQTWISAFCAAFFCSLALCPCCFFIFACFSAALACDCAFCWPLAIIIPVGELMCSQLYIGNPLYTMASFNTYPCVG